MQDAVSATADKTGTSVAVVVSIANLRDRLLPTTAADRHS